MALAAQSLQMILHSGPNLCASDAFLDSICSFEQGGYRYPSSPVFYAPCDPPSEIPQAIIYLTCEIVPHFGLGSRDRRVTPTRKRNFKNPNKHLRKMGRLKQPGGSSCNQRR